MLDDISFLFVFFQPPEWRNHLTLYLPFLILLLASMICDIRSREVPMGLTVAGMAGAGMSILGSSFLDFD